MNRFRKRKLLLITLLLLVTIPAYAAPVAAKELPAGPAGGQKTAIATASNLISRLIAEEAIPGMAAAVVADGAVIWTEGFGLANLEQRSPARASTRFRIGSISKPLTMTAVALLIEEEKIEPDRPIGNYSPIFSGKGDIITVRHLASHRSGIPHYSGNDFLQATRYDSVTAAMEKFWDRPLLFEPGSRFSYSSFGYNLLGAVVEQVADMAFVDFVAEEITRPLDLHSIVPDSYHAIIQFRSAYYHRGSDGAIHNAPPIDNSDLWPGGGYLANAADLARFGHAVINGNFLKTETLAMMLQPANEADGPGAGYALGWKVGSENGRRTVGHSGSHYGCMANLQVFPEENLVVATLANLSAEEHGDGGRPTKFYDLAGEIGDLFIQNRNPR